MRLAAIMLCRFQLLMYRFENLRSIPARTPLTGGIMQRPTSVLHTPLLTLGVCLPAILIIVGGNNMQLLLRKR